MKMPATADNRVLEAMRKGFTLLKHSNRYTISLKEKIFGENNKIK